MLRVESIAIDKIPFMEVLRYLGYRSKRSRPLPQTMIDLIQACRMDILSKRYARTVIRRMEIVREDNVVSTADRSLIFSGKSIARHLAQAHAVYLYAVTLGAETDHFIAERAKNAPEEALILDACATVAIEYAADCVEATLRQEASTGEYILMRYGPGYGDFPVAIQTHLLDTLDAFRLLNLRITDGNLILPQKTLTAISGISYQDHFVSTNKCVACSLRRTCAFSREHVYPCNPAGFENLL